jgi:endonuclease YncB( thermonuclease family)
MNARKTILAAALAALMAAPAMAEDIPATLIRVRDGDSVTVKLAGDCLPKLFRVQGVRFYGCDTPERGDKRPEIAALAREAKAFTAARLQPGQQVLLRDVRRDKYGGRVVARIEVDGEDLCRALIDAGLAREYSGKGKKPW